jgi:hypothetical protein
VVLFGGSLVEARGETDPLHPDGAHQPVGEARDTAEQHDNEQAWKQERQWGNVIKEVTGGAIYRGKSPSGVVA